VAIGSPVAGQDRESGSGDVGLLEAELVRRHEQLPALDALFLLNADGRLVVHTGRRDESAMRLPEQMPLTWSLLPGSSPRLRLLLPVRDAHRLTVGYLGGLIGNRGLGLMFDLPARSPGDIRSYILDPGGRLVHASGALAAPASGSAANLIPAALSDGGGFAHYRSAAGESVVGTLARVPDSDWRYLAEAPVDNVLAPLLRLRSLSLGFAAGLCVILLLTAWLVAGGIVAPVRRLVTAARLVGEGEPGVRVPAESADEIGELAMTFNEMTARLESASARVRELHQREIERAQQLATVGELASGVAHEIKNPVVGIAGGLDLVRRRLGRDAALSPILEEMSRQLKRIEGAVRDLLSYARPAAPSLTLVTVEHLVARATRLVQPAAEQAGVELLLRIAPDAPAIHADPELLTQSLVNLLMNAVQATSSGGSITVAGQRDGQAVRLEVADTGRGISADDLEHIFKPFFTTRHTGTGLGLSITRDIVERHGGRVEVQSKPGRGSTFTLLLPAADETADAEPTYRRVVA
jgi:signal transduction histidine kinase